VCLYINAVHLSPTKYNVGRTQDNAQERGTVRYNNASQCIAVKIITSQYIAIQHSIPQYNVIESSTGQFNNAEQERIGVTTQCDSTMQQHNAAPQCSNSYCNSAVQECSESTHFNTHFNNAVQQRSSKTQCKSTIQQHNATAHFNHALQHRNPKRTATEHAVQQQLTAPCNNTTQQRS